MVDNTAHQHVASCIRSRVFCHLGPIFDCRTLRGRIPYETEKKNHDFKTL